MRSAISFRSSRLAGRSVNRPRPMSDRSQLHGCIPILCTPFGSDGAVDYGSLEREVDWVISEGASGVAALALASEGYKLTESERAEITQVVVARAAGRVSVVISADGTGPEI